MALKVGELFGTLSLDDSNWDSVMKSAHSSLQSLGSNLKQIGSMMTVGITLPILGLGAAAIKTAGDMEQTKIALTTMLGSAEKATAFIKDIQQFAAKTPFEFSGLIQNSKQLIAFGYNANQIIPIMTNLGNAVSSVGGNGDTINRIIMQLGQMKSLGKASMEDIRPIAEAGVPVMRYLAQGLGKSQAEIAKMISAGELSAETFMDGLMRGMSNDSKLNGMMDKQSQTFLGQWSNLKDQVFQLTAKIGEPLIKIGSNVLQVIQPILNAIKKVADAFAKMPKGLQVLIVGLIGALAAAGPLLAMIGSIISAIISIIEVAPAIGAAIGTAVAAASGPVGWIIGGIVAIGAALVVAYKKVKPFRDAINQAWKSIKDAFSGLWESVKKFFSALSPLWNLYKKGIGMQLKAEFAAIGFVLKVIGLYVATIVDLVGLLIGKIAELLAKMQGKNSRPTLLTTLQELAIKATQQAQLRKLSLDEQKRKAAEVAQAEIDSIVKVIEKQRQQAEERRQQLRDVMGFRGVTELWQMAMEAGIKGSLGKAKESTEMTKADVPSHKVLMRIENEIVMQRKDQADMLALVRERLGVVAGVG